jgi:hypothetical protein
MDENRVRAIVQEEMAYWLKYLLFAGIVGLLVHRYC